MSVIAELSQGYRDLTIAATLHRLGDRTGTGQPWRAHSIAGVRYPYRLPNFTKEHDSLTLTQAAQQLGISPTVVKRGIAQGLFPARQVVPQAPWIIQRTALGAARRPSGGAGGTPGALPARSPPGPASVVGPGSPAGRSRACRSSPGGHTQPPAGGRRAVMAAMRLCRLQRQMLRWLMVDEQRTRGMSTRSHPALVAALPSAKGNISHSLRRLEMQGLIVRLRTPGGKTESVSLTAAGRQKALKLTGSDA